MADGLPSNRVYSAFKDSRGFLWFCTDLGVSRYNGLHLETFTTADGLADNENFHCYEDQKGRIWFASLNGKLSFFQNEEFFNAQKCRWLIPDKEFGLLCCFIRQSDSNFHIISIASKNYLDVKNNEITQIQYSEHSKKDPPGVRRLIYKRGDIKYYYRYAGNHNNPVKYLSVVRTEGDRTTVIASELIETKTRILNTPDMNNSMIIQLKDQLFNLDKKKFIKEDLGSKEVYAYYHKDDLEILGYKTGLEIDKKGSKKFILKGKHITSIRTDYLKNLVVTTYNHGVYILQKKKEHDNIITENVEHIIHKGDRWFISTTHGDIMEMKGNNLRTVLTSDEILYQYKDVKDKLVGLFPYNDSIVSLSFLGRKTIFGTNNFKGRTMGRASNGTPERFSHAELVGDILYQKYILWLSTYDFKNNQHIPVVSESTMARILDIAKDSKNNVWVNTSDMFYKYLKDRLVACKHLGTLGFERFDFIQDKLIGIDNNNRLWIVDHYLDEKRFKTKSILPSYKFRSLKKIDENAVLCQDDRKHNWLLRIINNQPYVFELINEVRTAPLENIHSDNTSIFLSKERSTKVYDISEISLQEWHPKLFLKTVMVNSGIAPKGSNVNIPFERKGNISIEYMTLSKGDEQLKYEYAIQTHQNEDTVWIANDRPSLDLINPQWGHYQVLFRVGNRTGRYSNIITQTINITPPFYLRWWFITVFMLALIIMTFYGTSLFRLNRQKKILRRKEEEKKNIQSEFKSLNALMNPHFIFNSLNNIQGLINNDKKETANYYLVTFSDLVRQNMMNVQNDLISLEKELYLVKNYLLLEKMRFENQLEYIINVSNSISLDEVMVPPLTIQPLIENAIKHGILPLENKTGRIVLDIALENDTCVIVVKDNGVGFENSQNHTGSKSALRNIKKRFELLSKIHGYFFELEIIDLDKGAEFKNKVVIRISAHLNETL